MDTRPPCRNFASAGTCKFGDNCRFSHGPQGQGYTSQSYGPPGGGFRPQGGNHGHQGGYNAPGGYPSPGGNFSQQGGFPHGGGRGGRQNFSSNRPNAFVQGPGAPGFSGGAPRGPKNPSKPKSCFFYHRDKCTHANCRDLHQYTYQNDLTKASRYDLPANGSAVVMITPTQVAAATGNTIVVFDYQSQQVLAQLQTQCTDILLGTFTAGQMTFLVFGGNSNRQACLGVVHPQNSSISYCQLQTNGALTSMYSDSKVIVAGDSSGNLHVCTLSSEGLRALGQPYSSPEPAPLTCLTVMNDIALGGNAQGMIVGWQLNNGQANSLGYLSARHGGAVRGLDFQDQILYSCGEDGVVFRFDAANGFQFECFYPTKQSAQPVAITTIKLSWSRQAQVLLMGDASGKVKIMNTANRENLGTLGFFQNAPALAFSAVVSAGVFASLGERTVHIMQWT